MVKFLSLSYDGCNMVKRGMLVAEFSEEMATLIKGWGLSQQLQGYKNDIIFKFDDNNISTTTGMGYHCHKNSVKFCLYNEKIKKVLFTMDFYMKDRCAFGDPVPRINLQFIYTHLSSLRKKGIADYYIAKLREYAISQNVKCISITAVLNVVIDKCDNGLNRLKKHELERFYKKRSTADMPIIVTALS